jgi:thioredoxin 1
MKEIKNFQELEDALKSSESNVVVIDCYTKWCGPCKRLSPKLEELQKRYTEEGKNVEIYKLDIEIEDLSMWVSMKEIQSIPTIFVVKDKKDTAKIEGADLEAIIKAVEEQFVVNN